jgi:virginiamycin B lyase
LQLVPVSNTGVILSSKTTAAFYDLTVQITTTNLSLTETQVVPVSITASPSALTGTYKVLLSARTNDVTVSQFVTVNITP